MLKLTMRQYKLIKKHFNLDEFIFTWGVRIVLLIFIIYGLMHFNENPIVISIFAVIIFIILSLLRVDGQILILNESEIIKRDIIFALWKKDEIFQIKNIKEIHISGEYTVELDMMRKFIPYYQDLDPNEILILFKDGTHKKLKVRFYKKQMIKFVNIVNSMIR